MDAAKRSVVPRAEGERDQDEREQDEHPDDKAAPQRTCAPRVRGGSSGYAGRSRPAPPFARCDPGARQPSLASRKPVSEPRAHRPRLGRPWPPGETRLRASSEASRCGGRGCGRSGGSPRTPRGCDRSRPRRTSAGSRRGAPASASRARTRSSSPWSSAPPPARTMPRSMMSAASSGGVLSSVDFMASMICVTGSSSARRISSERDDRPSSAGR